MDPVRPTVLIVDDHPANIHLLAEALAGEYEIIVATNGQEAIELALAGDAPDLILLDILMPGMSGYEVCERLKKEEWTKSVPVIFVTAKNREEDETYGLQVGAVDYITKPFSMPIVKARVRAHVELKHHRDLLETLSLRDGLTGIANRRQFEQHLERCWRLASRERIPLSLCMADIDHFKLFNDRYGHLSGDECLRNVARAMEKCANRPMDLVARFGGEEFVAILHGTDRAGAALIGETMRDSIEALTIPNNAVADGAVVTLSVGVATVIPNDLTAAADLVNRADQALYRAKGNGRNCLVSDESK
jgi:diguanylate cyclase (GGDEF)-like protein